MEYASTYHGAKTFIMTNLSLFVSKRALIWTCLQEKLEAAQYIHHRKIYATPSTYLCCASFTME
jgi:hypothetical protein